MNRQSLIQNLFRPTLTLHTVCIGRVSYICPQQKLMHETFKKYLKIFAPPPPNKNLAPQEQLSSCGAVKDIPLFIKKDS